MENFKDNPNLKLKELQLEELSVDKKIKEIKFNLKLLGTRELLERIIILGDFLESIKNKEFVLTKDVEKLIKKDKKLKATFNIEGTRAYIVEEKFKELAEEYWYIERRLEKEKGYFGW
ncbi:hypothetical protein [Bacillus infantis]|uniref:hypothetical protein n=1 Tax=Bacillus infantis TaxID=324767 RepID=UPI003CECD034